MSRQVFALILAGGSGTRFWPLSRNAKPKQLLRLFDDSTLIEKTMQRLDGLVPKENVLVLTNHEQIAGVREALPDLPPENIVAEPAKRDTAPAVALGIGWVAARDPEAVMVILPADQLIQDVGQFQKVMRAAVEAADKGGGLVTVGIKPTWPCPSYGYIERGEEARIPGTSGAIPVHAVRRFREKPNPTLAQQFLDEGGFTWNAGMFIWAVPTARAELALHCPELSEFIGQVEKAGDLQAVLSEHFALLPKISIDFALMEKARLVHNIEATFDWDDVGSWISVAKYFPDESGNHARAPLTSVDAQGNIVFSTEGKRVALLGVSDLIVVQTGDALLIADRSKADKIKDLVDLVPKELQ